MFYLMDKKKIKNKYLSELVLSKTILKYDIVSFSFLFFFLK